MFWIINAILILIASAFVLPALLRKQKMLKDGRREQNIFIANEQLKELEVRFEQGEIDGDAYQSARDELEQALFSDVSNIDNTLENSAPEKSSLLSSILIALLIPAIAIPVYLKMGNLNYTTMLDSKKAAAQAAAGAVPRKADGTPDIDTMVAGLQKKMESDPDNAKGWYMLGRSYMVLKRYSDAVKSYEKAYQLKPDSADIMLSLADSLAMQNKGDIAGRPAELINKSLELEPDNLTALWLGGMAARQQKDYLTAIQRWKKVTSLLEDDAERQEVNTLIAETMKQLTPAQKEKLGVTTSNNAEALNVAKTETKSANAAVTSISVSVSLSNEMMAKVKPTDLVFVYAKAMSGPPMPLAAAKVQVKDLPVEIVLNDDMAMMPNMKLSSFSEVIVGARVSKTGQPIAQNGDLFTEKKSIKAGDKVSLEINSVVNK